MTAPLRERTPDRGRGAWSRGQDVPKWEGVLSISTWHLGMTTVISALEWAEYPDGVGEGPQWHISVSAQGTRPRSTDVRRALRAFGIGHLQYDEDNHHPGNARHFWVPVDPDHRVACQCKTDETLVTEADGYRWSNPKNGPCAGCETAPLFGKVCPLHPELPVGGVK